MGSGMHNPRQAVEAKIYSDRASAVLERSLPRGTKYVVALVRPGSFGTVAANVDKREQLELLQGLVAQLQLDAAGG